MANRKDAFANLFCAVYEVMKHLQLCNQMFGLKSSCTQTVSQFGSQFQQMQPTDFCWTTSSFEIRVNWSIGFQTAEAYSRTSLMKHLSLVFLSIFTRFLWRNNQILFALPVMIPINIFFIRKLFFCLSLNFLNITPEIRLIFS